MLGIMDVENPDEAHLHLLVLSYFVHGVCGKYVSPGFASSVGDLLPIVPGLCCLVDLWRVGRRVEDTFVCRTRSMFGGATASGIPGFLAVWWMSLQRMGPRDGDPCVDHLEFGDEGINLIFTSSDWELRTGK